MPNQVLALHRVSPRCYDLSRVRTGNVRDQLLRSTVIVNALYSEGLIGNGWPLLVYGAGPAGMNAAMLAAERRIDAVVLERTQKLFQTIFLCAWRRVDPTEYDWPHAHWLSGAFPRSGKNIPLSQPYGMTAFTLAAAWRKKWRDFENKMKVPDLVGKVEVLHGVNANNLTLSDTGLGALLSATGPWDATNPARSTRHFGAVLSCIGYGDELVGEEPRNGRWNNYAGPRFWHDNDTVTPNAPLPRTITNVVISGGGDGAMQDFQRLASSQALFGRELYTKLRQLLRETGLDALRSFPNPDQRLRFLSAEETGRRAFSWAPDRYGVPDAMAQWHDAFAGPVDAAVASWPDKVAKAVADKLFRTELLDSKLKIRWVMQDPTPGYAYALNRFLSLVLLALARKCQPSLDITVHNSSSIQTIAPAEAGHECVSAPGCIGKKHVVLIAPRCGHGATAIEEADLIIIRHGLEPRPQLLGGRLPVPEQISPFDLPH